MWSCVLFWTCLLIQVRPQPAGSGRDVITLLISYSWKNSEELESNTCIVVGINLKNQLTVFDYSSNLFQKMDITKALTPTKIVFDLMQILRPLRAFPVVSQIYLVYITITAQMLVESVHCNY